MTELQLKGIMSKKSDHWKTPKQLKNRIRYDKDICPLYSKKDNLKIDWPKDKIIFCNPPYSQIKIWIDKIICEVKEGAYVKLLIPARTDTKYFHKLMNSGCVSKILFFEGRLKFNEKLGAPFPSILIMCNKSNKIDIQFLSANGNEYL